MRVRLAAVTFTALFHVRAQVAKKEHIMYVNATATGLFVRATGPFWKWAAFIVKFFKINAY